MGVKCYQSSCLFTLMEIVIIVKLSKCQKQKINIKEYTLYFHCNPSDLYHSTTPSFKEDSSLVVEIHWCICHLPWLTCPMLLTLISGQLCCWDIMCSGCWSRVITCANKSWSPDTSRVYTRADTAANMIQLLTEFMISYWREGSC